MTPEQRAAGRVKGGLANSARRTMEADQRRARVLELLRQGSTVRDALADVGVTDRTWRIWRKEHRQFRAATDAVRGMSEARDSGATDLSFIAWRKRYLNSDTTWFQAQIVEALQDDSLGGGTITLVLFPPEHGKTTTIEDFITWKFCVDKGYRVTYGSESQAHSRKALRRVRNRMEIDGPFPQLVADYGPFAPPAKSWDHHGNQPWGQDFFDIHGRTKSDERDYSMVALGFGSQIAGSRTDLLVGDDLTSMRNNGQAAKLFETFRQDWLSRPGTKGRTVIIGTRVADGDLYDLMEDADLPDKIVRFRAHDEGRIHHFGTPWLWPERYTEDEYAKMRKNVGEAAWARNYQQAPRLAGDSTFTDTMLSEVSLPMRSVLHPPAPDVKGIIVSLDPGFGVNACIAQGATGDRLDILGGRRDVGLSNTQQIFEAVEQTYRDARGTSSVPWLHLVIEDKAFQKGLIDDASLKELQKRYGFTVHGHQTGINKYDETIGVPAMARDFLRQIITLPGADDPETLRFRQWFDEEHVRWRPNKRGTQLVQDCVMASWFGWLWWSKFRAGLESRTNTQPPQMAGIPWRPTMLPGGVTRLPA